MKFAPAQYDKIYHYMVIEYLRNKASVDQQGKEKQGNTGVKNSDTKDNTGTNEIMTKGTSSTVNVSSVGKREAVNNNQMEMINQLLKKVIDDMTKIINFVNAANIAT